MMHLSEVDSSIILHLWEKMLGNFVPFIVCMNDRYLEEFIFIVNIHIKTGVVQYVVISQIY